MTEEIIVLHQKAPPQGWSIMVALDPFPVDNLVPEEVARSVCHLLQNRARGPSGMREEHFRS